MAGRLQWEHVKGCRAAGPIFLGLARPGDAWSRLMVLSRAVWFCMGFVRY